MKNDNKFVCIGQITAAHGINGHFRLRSYTTPPKQFFSYGKIHDSTGHILVIKFIRDDKPTANNNFFICRIADITDRNAAELVAGTDIYILRQDLAAVTTDELYVIDIEGITVYNAIDDAVVGVVNAVVNYGAGDILEIKTTLGELILIPFEQQYFPLIDLPNNKIQVNLPNYM